MAVLILTPVFEKLEDGINPILGMRIEMTENCNVAPVANLLRQISGIEDELRLEERVTLALGLKAQVQL